MIPDKSVTQWAIADRPPNPDRSRRNSRADCAHRNGLPTVIENASIVGPDNANRYRPFGARRSSSITRQSIDSANSTTSLISRPMEELNRFLSSQASCMPQNIPCELVESVFQPIVDRSNEAWNPNDPNADFVEIIDNVANRNSLASYRSSFANADAGNQVFVPASFPTTSTRTSNEEPNRQNPSISLSSHNDKSSDYQSVVCSNAHNHGTTNQGYTREQFEMEQAPPHSPTRSSATLPKFRSRVRAAWNDRYTRNTILAICTCFLVLVIFAAGIFIPKLHYSDTEHFLGANDGSANATSTNTTIASSLLSDKVSVRANGTSPPTPTLTPPVDKHQQPLLPIAALFDPALQPVPLNGSWTVEGHRLHRRADGSLVRYDVRTDTETLLLAAHHPELRAARSYEISADGTFLLIGDAPRGYRLIALDQLPVPLRHARAMRLTHERHSATPVDYASFGRRGSQLAFVQNGHVHYYERADDVGAIVSTVSTQPRLAPNATASSSIPIYRGICDYTYGEWMFEGQPAMWWSPDGGQLAFATFDDRRLDRTMDSCWEPRERRDETQIPYAVMGGRNPAVYVSVMNLTGSLGELQLLKALPKPDWLADRERSDEELVLASAGWSEAGRFVAVWMDRLQTRATVWGCGTTRLGAGCQVITNITAQSGWLRLSGRLHIDTQFLGLVQSIGDFRSLIVYHLHPDGVHASIVTTNLHVDRIVHYDRTAGLFFYLASTVDEPWHRHLYAVSSRGIGPLNGDCLTCANEHIDAGLYQHFDAHFHRSGSQMLVLEAQGPAVPRHDIFEWSVRADDARLSRQPLVSIRHLRTLQSNLALRQRLAVDGIPQPHVEWLSIGDGINIRLLRPHGYADAAPDSVPLLVQPYRAPDTYRGTSEWRWQWPEFMAASRLVAVAQVDGRGATRQPVGRTHAVHGRNPGRLEAEDLLQAAGWLVARERQLSEPQVGIWGEGLAGYMAGWASANRTLGKVFRCTALVEPVVDWWTQVSLFADRLLGRPGEDVYLQMGLMQRAHQLHEHSEHLAVWEAQGSGAPTVQENGLRGVYQVPHQQECQKDRDAFYGEQLVRFFDGCLVL